MEDRKNGSAKSEMHDHMCDCGMHGNGTMWGHNRFMVLRLIIGLGIIFIAFYMGLKIGEFKGMMEGSGFGGYRTRGMMDDRMMRNSYYGAPVQMNKALPVPSPSGTTKTPLMNANVK